MNIKDCEYFKDKITELTDDTRKYYGKIDTFYYDEMNNLCLILLDLSGTGGFEIKLEDIVDIKEITEEECLKHSNFSQ